MSRPLGPNELRLALEASRAANERLLADVEALRVKNSLLAASLKNQDDEIESLRRQHDEAVARNVQLITELAEARDASRALNEQVVKLQAAVIGVRLTNEERAALTKEREEVISTVEKPRRKRSPS